MFNLFKMPYINSTKFGEIVVDGKKYNHDIKILVDGKIVKRYGPRGSHEICLEEFDEILKDPPEVIVVGNGQNGVAKIEEKAIEKIKSKGIKLIVEETPKAIITFNKLKNKKAGIFHLTC